MPSERFVVAYEQTAEDWRAYYRFIRRDVVAGNAWDRRGAFRFHVWTAAVFGGVLGLVVASEGFNATHVVVSLIVTSGFAVIYGRFIWPRVGSDENVFVKAAMAQRAGRGESRMTLTADDAEEITAVTRVAVCWPLIQRVERTADHLFLMFAPDQGFFIPLRGFSKLEDADAFCAAAARFHAACQPPGRALGFPVIPPPQPAADLNSPSAPDVP